MARTPQFRDIPGRLYIHVVSWAVVRLSRAYTALEHTLPVCTRARRRTSLSLYALSDSFRVQL